MPNPHQKHDKPKLVQKHARNDRGGLLSGMVVVPCRIDRYLEHCICFNFPLKFLMLLVITLDIPMKVLMFELIGFDDFTTRLLDY
jgi:hypothetical protein